MSNPNYSPEMVAALKAEPIWNLETAKRVSREMGKTTRSIVAKVINLGLDYQATPRSVRKDGSDIIRKADTVAAIAKALDADADELAGLARASRSALEALLREIP